MALRTWIRGLAIVLVSLNANLGHLHAQAGEREARLKAAFLLNFAKLLSWPDDASSDRIVCALGPSPVAEALSTIDGRQAGGKVIRTRQIAAFGQTTACDIVFITMPDSALDSTLAKLHGRPVLTVGDGAEFARRGGGIGLTTWRNRVRIVLNVPTVGDSGLGVSSQLLRLAQVVQDGGGGSTEP